MIRCFLIFKVQSFTFAFFAFFFQHYIFSVGDVQRDISIGFSDTLVIVTVQIAKARSILHQHCLPNTIYFLLMKCTKFFCHLQHFKIKILAIWETLIKSYRWDVSLTVWRYESWDNRGTLKNDFQKWDALWQLSRHGNMVQEGMRRSSQLTYKINFVIYWEIWATWNRVLPQPNPI